MAPISRSLSVVSESISDSKSTNVQLEITESEPKEYNYEDALALIGFGKVQLFIIFVSGLVLMAVINETMGMMIINIASQCDLSTNDQQKAILSAASFIGIFVSSHLWGYLADTTGRRKVIMYSILGSNVFSILSCFISNYWLFVLCRFCTGIGISGPSACLYAYLGEFHTIKHRPVVINYASLGVGMATIYISGVAWLILGQTWSFELYEGFLFRPWRLILLCYLLPGTIGAICLSQLPETPKYLLASDRQEEALEIVHWIYEKNLGKPAKYFEVKKLALELNSTKVIENITTTKTCCDVIKSIWNQTIPLFRRPHLGNFLICCVAMFGAFFVSSGFGLWYPEIQNRLGTINDTELKTICNVISPEKGSQLIVTNDSSIDSSSEAVCDDTVNEKTYLDSITLGMFYLIAYCVLGVILNPVGRKIIITSVLLVSGFCGLTLHWISHPTAIVVLFCLFIMLPGICISVLCGSVVDLTPTNLRGMAVCICLMLGRLGSAFGSNIIGLILVSYCTVTFSIFAAFMIFCGLLTILLPS